MYCKALTSGSGAHNLTTGSIPLVASKHDVGWLWRQLTIESSPFITLTMLPLDFSQQKNFPSSDPATINRPSLKIAQNETTHTVQVKKLWATRPRVTIFEAKLKKIFSWSIRAMLSLKLNKVLDTFQRMMPLLCRWWYCSDRKTVQRSRELANGILTPA